MVTTQLHFQSRDIISQANALDSLGELQIRPARLNEADKSFIDASMLHSRRPRGNALENLSELQIRINRFDEAESHSSRPPNYIRHPTMRLPGSRT
jgi:hypothetical protein